MVSRLVVVAIVCTALAARAEPDAGVVLDVETAVVVTDAGAQHVTGGCYLSDPKCVSVARELVSLRAENASLKSSAVPPPAWLVGVCAGALLIGVAGGAAVVTLWPSAPQPR